MDREKVIGHLGILRTWCAVNPAYGRGLDVEDCAKAVGWLDDAIGMMMAEGERETTSSVSAVGAATFPRGEGSGEAQAAVVRCGECRYWRQEVSPTEHWVCAHHSFNERKMYTTPIFYCADGERRDGA